MSNTTVNRDELEFLVELLQEEFEQLHALSTTLSGRLQPNDPNNPNGRDDLVSWRIAQILEGKLETLGCKDRIKRQMESIFGISSTTGFGG